MKKQRNSRRSQQYILPLFVVAASLVFAVLFAILLTPSVLTKFGFEPVLILLLVISGITSSMLAILFYLLLTKKIKL